MIQELSERSGPGMSERATQSRVRRDRRRKISVKNDDEVFSSEGNADLYDRHDFDLDSSDQGDFYEIEWDLDFKS